jgi:antitoxin component of MazEF toxin-antitoxin module
LGKEWQRNGVHVLLFALPQSDRIKYDLAVRASLERESGTEFIFFVADGYLLVLVGLAVTVDAYSDLPLFVFDDQINPFIKLHVRIRFGESRAIRQPNSVASSLEIVEGDHVVADLKNRTARGEFLRLELVAQVTNKLFRDAIEVNDGFQAEVVISIQGFHRHFFGFEQWRYDQFAILDFFVFFGCSPSFPVEFPIKIVGVDQGSGFKHFRLKFRLLGTETG